MHVVYVVYLFVCFYVCCASPRWCVASFVRSSLLCWFCVPPLCPFIPFCSSMAVMTLRRYGHARTGIPFIPYVCEGGHRHSFGVTSCCVFLAGAVFVALFVAAHFGVAWHVTYLHLGGHCCRCCLCPFCFRSLSFVLLCACVPFLCALGALPCVLCLLRRYAWRYALWRCAWRGI